MKNLGTISSITFFEYQKGRRWWAFNQMQLAIKPLKEVKGISFFRLLGTGSGIGFSVKPDFRTYALLIVWENSKAAGEYTLSDAYLRFNQRCKTNFTYWMGCTQSVGTWHGNNPFEPDFQYTSGPLMVLTRARVRLSRVGTFLRNVPVASESLKRAEGVIFSKGIGQLPIIEQATFSFWETEKDMLQYAYRNEHRKIIQKVRKNKWYSEELFARFIPIQLKGDE